MAPVDVIRNSVHRWRTAMARWGRVRALRRHFAAQPLVFRPCPLCGAGRGRPLVRGDRDYIGIRTSQCEDCGFVFSSPFFPPETVAEFYRESYRALFKGQPDPAEFAAREGYLRERAAFYQAFFAEQDLIPPRGGRVLDVGCGEGTLLRTIAARRPDLAVAGVEPTVAYATHLTADTGIPVVPEVAALPPDSRYDLVTLVHVLEHVHDPVSLLRQIRGHLAAGGKLYVDVPDVAMHATVMDLHLAHCNHFSVHTLAAALGRAGFAVHRVASHRPPTLPPSVFAVAGPADLGATREVARDPQASVIGRRVAGIDTGVLGGWRWLRRRLAPLRAARRAGEAPRASETRAAPAGAAPARRGRR